jgi:hypothetical protein
MGQIEFLLFLSLSEGISPPLGLFSTLKKKIPQNQIKKQCRELISTQVLKKSHKIRE